MLEIRSVERGICPVAKIYYIFFTVHAQNGHLSTYTLKSDVTIVFLDHNYLQNGNSGDSDIKKGYIAYFHCACMKQPYFHFRSKSDITIMFFHPVFIKDAKILAIHVHLRQI